MLDAFLLLMVTVLLNLLSLKVTLWAVTTVYFLSVPLLTGGRTFGKWIVRIRLQSEEAGPAKAWMVWVRYGVLYGIFGGINALTPNSP